MVWFGLCLRSRSLLRATLPRRLKLGWIQIPGRERGKIWERTFGLRARKEVKKERPERSIDRVPIRIQAPALLLAHERTQRLEMPRHTDEHGHKEKRKKSDKARRNFDLNGAYSQKHVRAAEAHAAAAGNNRREAERESHVAKRG